MTTIKRDTREIKSGKYKATIHTYLTAREAFAIEAIAKRAMKVKIENGVPVMDDSNFDISHIEQLTKQEVVKTLVVSFNGSKENIYEQMLDIKNVHFNELYAELEKVIAGVSSEKKRA